MRKLPLLCLLLTLWSQSALAQTERELLQALRQSTEGKQRIKGGCTDRIRPISEWRLADLDQDGTAEVVAPWSTEGCGGGNYWGASVGVFKQSGGRWQEIDSAGIEGQPESIEVRGNQIRVRTKSYGPNDPRCCPSQMVTVRLALSNGKLRESR